MAKKKNPKLTSSERLELLQKIGKGIVDLATSGPGPRYAITSLGLYALGRTCLFPCGLIGGIQGVNTVIAVSEVTEDTGPFSGVTNGLLSGGTGVAAGILMNDLLADKCGCPKVIPPASQLPLPSIEESKQYAYQLWEEGPIFRVGPYSQQEIEELLGIE